MSRAKALRATLAPAEKAMWRIVHERELVALNWRRQAPFGTYVLDLVSHPARLVLEVDGAHHAEAAQALHDERRTAFLRSHGYRVERIPNNAALRHGDGVWVSVRAWAWETPARARMERWLTAHASPSMGEAAARSAAGGGEGENDDE